MTSCRQAFSFWHLSMVVRFILATKHFVAQSMNIWVGLRDAFRCKHELRILDGFRHFFDVMEVVTGKHKSVRSVIQRIPENLVHQHPLLNLKVADGTRSCTKIHEG
ncbi:uncharacterized protein LOC112493690 isoform X2 [Cephus cinctus]|uniref:Uncharacterized protein LOC112493690 isoform X2 n=1 Tax=Cephus cinctus TaxID=211228 RepID=A0AAJ7R823_CEPCN|nr:uncharacterized protein LOC112493690 isoform X2 [Cephus cinctus]